MVTLLLHPLSPAAFPLAAAALNFIFGKQLKAKTAWISSAASLMSFAVSVFLLTRTAAHGVMQGSIIWLEAGNFKITSGFLLDPLSASFLAVVSLVGMLIQIYAAGSMKDDPEFTRFYSTLSLFMAAMTALIAADGLLLFFMAWEIMGLCSFLLIGFWFQKEAAAKAAHKAFLATRLGDLCLLLGLLMLSSSLGTLQFTALSEKAAALGASAWLSAAALLIFAGAAGKSAQFPFHIWLPDAMEGPTPVSALIHAATMVAAGIYLLIRTFPVLALDARVLSVIAAVGTFTAVLTALLALRSQEIKKTLAFSTLSQLGMMAACIGFSNPGAAFFHLVTHAFFKALLFMGAGNVLHACGTQNLGRLGGLGRPMKLTSGAFLVGSLALAGLPPLSGFWSKEGILAAAHGYSPFYFGALLLTSFLTALYSARLYLQIFEGSASRSADAETARECPKSMTIPLLTLGVLAAAAGIPGSPWMGYFFQTFIGISPHGDPASYAVLAGSLIACALGLAGAWLSAGPWRGLGLKETAGAGRFLEKAGMELPNSAARLFASGLKTAGRAAACTDRLLLDGAVMLPGVLLQLAAAGFRKIQSGFILHYLLAAFAAVIGLLAAGMNF